MRHRAMEVSTPDALADAARGDAAQDEAEVSLELPPDVPVVTLVESGQAAEAGPGAGAGAEAEGGGASGEGHEFEGLRSGDGAADQEVLSKREMSYIRQAHAAQREQQEQEQWQQEEQQRVARLEQLQHDEPTPQQPPQQPPQHQHQQPPQPTPLAVSSGAAPSGAASKNWNCAVCTYANETPGAVECAICGAPRSSPTSDNTQDDGAPQMAPVAGQPSNADLLAPLSTAMPPVGGPNLGPQTAPASGEQQGEAPLASAAAAGPAPADWACSVCTLVNSHNDRRCVACRSLRAEQEHGFKV